MVPRATGELVARPFLQGTLTRLLSVHHQVGKVGWLWAFPPAVNGRGGGRLVAESTRKDALGNTSVPFLSVSNGLCSVLLCRLLVSLITSQRKVRALYPTLDKNTRHVPLLVHLSFLQLRSSRSSTAMTTLVWSPLLAEGTLRADLVTGMRLGALGSSKLHPPPTGRPDDSGSIYDYRLCLILTA